MLNPSVENCKSVILLKNGHLSVGKNSIQTFNTCPFDSLYVMVASLYADFISVKSQVDQLGANCDFSKMIITMFDDEKKPGIKQNSLLKQRNLILKRIFLGTIRITEFGNGLSSIDCSANINYMIPRALPIDLYSYVRKRKCDRCNTEVVSNRCFIDINIEQFEQQSIQNLNSCLLDSLMAERSSNCECGGSKKLTDTTFSNFIMIDLYLKTRIAEISLVEIPKTLNFLGIDFAIHGCIEYIGDDENTDTLEDSIGHYVSHIYRRNNQWQRYDDKKSKITNSDTTSKIKGQVLFYVKKD